MIRRRLSTTFLALVTISCFAAMASAEVSISVYSGTSDTATSDLRIREPSSDSDATFHGVRWQARPFEDSPYYGIRLAYFQTNSSRIGASLDFTHYKIYAETERTLALDGRWDGVTVKGIGPMYLRVQHFEVSHGLNLAALNMIYRWPLGPAAALPESRWQAYVGAGLVAYVPHAEATINGNFTSAGYQLGGFGYQVLAGLQCRVSRRMSLFAELKQDGGGLNMDFQGDTRARTGVRTFHALGGVTLSLGRSRTPSGSDFQPNRAALSTVSRSLPPE